jgi:adenosyl cobinamide kinase/adenosyl cobinamide phosphate guanylyltransferase/NaMN:DMB phosphoribosyltransferase
LLILGGIRSGKSEFAEHLVAERVVSGAGEVRYVATAGAGPDDPEWAERLAAHRARRPAGWVTEEIGGDPGRLVALLAEAKPDDTLLVDDLGGWLTATIDAAGTWSETGPAAGAPSRPAARARPAAKARTGAKSAVAATADAGAGSPDDAGALAAAVRGCAAAMLVLVSPEVGLSVVPATPAGRAFADRIGRVNQAVAAACDAVAFVVAGQPAWLKGADPAVADRRASAGPGSRTSQVSAPTIPVAPTWAVPAATATAAPGITPAATPAAAPVGAGSADDSAVSAVGPVSNTDEIAIAVGMSLPMPDESAAEQAGERLAGLDFGGAGLGALAATVRFAAGTQGQPVPRPWQSVRMFLLHADHDGGVSAGDSPTATGRRVDAAERGEGSWALLAGAAGVAVQTVRWPTTAAAIEHTDALSEAEVESALRYGWQLAESAADSGTDLIVLGASGAGAEAAAVAVIVSVASGEAATLLGPVTAPDGRIDDAAWMHRCAAVRDALHRVRSRARDPRALLGTLGGPDHAVATGILLGAVSRRTPVVVDGPVGAAAALVARDFGAQTRHWILLPDTGGHPAVGLAAETLGTTAVLDLKLGLGEGATALAALPLLRSALTLAAFTAEAPPAPQPEPRAQSAEAEPEAPPAGQTEPATPPAEKPQSETPAAEEAEPVTRPAEQVRSDPPPAANGRTDAPVAEAGPQPSPAARPAASDEGADGPTAEPAGA